MPRLHRIWILLLCGVFALGGSTTAAWSCSLADESELASDDSESSNSLDPVEQALPARLTPAARSVSLPVASMPLLGQEPAVGRATYSQPLPWLSVGNGIGGPLRC